MRKLRKKLLLTAVLAMACTATVFSAGTLTHAVKAETEPNIETNSDIAFDFEDAEQENSMTVLTNGGWTVRDGKYHPSQAGVLHNFCDFYILFFSLRH